MPRALITGLAGETLTANEYAFLRRERPCGIILFSRNCGSLEQVKALVAHANEAVQSPEFLVLVDQEGGRIQRLKPPTWRALPTAAAFGALHRHAPSRGRAAARLVARLTADDLRSVGINTNCTPVADVPVANAHEIIGDRAYGSDPRVIAELAREVATGYLEGGVLPVMKHIPGHGRAMADSHVELPVVTAPHSELAASDFAPFRALRDLPAAMTAHVVFTALDPDRPASISGRVTHDIIRGEIGFEGLLMSDDLGMKALQGSMAERAKAVIEAGTDLVLHCSGDFEEMQQAAAATPTFDGPSLARFRRCTALLARNDPFDREAAEFAVSEALAVSA